LYNVAFPFIKVVDGVKVFIKSCWWIIYFIAGVKIIAPRVIIDASSERSGLVGSASYSLDCGGVCRGRVITNKRCGGEKGKHEKCHKFGFQIFLPLFAYKRSTIKNACL
jgi:hypothetical protein